MAGLPQNGMRCTEFEALLTEAIDGVLPQNTRPRFEAHREACSACQSMYAEADAGRHWLLSLEDVPPPAGMVERILVATTGVSERADAGVSIWESVRAWITGPARGTLSLLLQPRVAMSFAMAFFSFSMVLNVLGIQIRDVRNVDLRPQNLVRIYHQTAGQVVRYYENIRIVYEIQSRVQDLRDSVTAPEPSPAESPEGGSPPPGDSLQNDAKPAGPSGEFGPRQQREQEQRGARYQVRAGARTKSFARSAS
ncbi:MAG: anti-sigma factor [Candidatus Korobacteraceae bacterium]